MKDFLGVVLVAVLMLVWNGMVVSAFPTAPEITFWQSFVVAFVLGMFTGGVQKSSS